jgi:tetratricopeptide (TPR) repeat protein
MKPEVVTPQHAATMNRRTHPSLTELADFVAGQPQDEHETQWIESHLATCQECCRQVADVAPDRFQERLSQLADPPPLGNNGTVRLSPGYELLGVLGRGGSGIVYRARQAGLDREVAWKTLAAGANATPQQFARFRHESLALSRVQHPHIVEIYDVGDQDGAPFLAMEYVCGPTLAELLQAGPLEVDKAIELTIQLADAVQCAHEHGILHRDLKPQNVLLKNGSIRHAKLADFGLSYLYHSDASITNTGDPLGTPSYMAPEMIRGGNRETGKECDVYGLGAILYECLTGRPPFRGASAVETMDMALHQDPVPLQQLRVGVPKDIQTVCHCALEKDPVRRYPTAAALRADLVAFQQSRPIVARTRSVPYRVSLWIRRNPWPATWLVTVVAAAAIGMICLLAYQYTIAEQRDRANRRYADARATIWSVLNVADRTNSFQIPKLGELTLQQAQHALQLFEKLAAEDPSPEAQRDLAHIRTHTGTLLIKFGKSVEGGELLAQASRELHRLTDGPPQQTSELLDLLASQANLAISLTCQDRADEAEKILQPALELADQALKQNPDHIALLQLVAWLHHESGNVAFHQREFEEMRECIRKAIRYRTKVLQLDPGNRDCAKKLAESRTNLAQAECQSGNLDTSEAEFQAAIDVLQSLTSVENPDAEVLMSLASARMNLSNVLAGQQKMEAAVDSCTRGIVEIESVLEVEPHDASARLTCCQLHGNRALYRAPLGQHAEALQDWQIAVQFADANDVKAYCQMMRVRWLITEGLLVDAEQEAAELERLRLDPVNQFRIAAMWGMIGNAIQDERPGDADATDRADRYFARAAATVADLIEDDGYLLKHPEDARYVEASDDFREVRVRMSRQHRQSLASACAN